MAHDHNVNTKHVRAQNWKEIYNIITGEWNMIYLLLGMFMVGSALAVHMIINLDLKTGEWKGRYKGKWLPL
jgi:hypothetical protein